MMDRMMGMVLLELVLGWTALIKYLFFSRR